MISFFGRFKPFFFLIGGISLIIGLAIVKFQHQAQCTGVVGRWYESYETDQGQILPRLPCPMLERELDGCRYFIAERPVSNAEFFRFVQDSGYRSWREERGHAINWRHPVAEAEQPSYESDPDGPVLWLTQNDAVAYCIWLAQDRGRFSPYEEAGKLWHNTGPRLPRAKELEELAPGGSSWEWTCHNLYDFEPQALRNSDYLSAWKKESPLRHRRERDMGRDDVEATTFRIAWTYSASEPVSKS